MDVHAIPVLIQSTDAVEYLSADTMVLPHTAAATGKVALVVLDRIPTLVTLPDGRLARVLGWDEETLRLRMALAGVQDAAAKVQEARMDYAQTTPSTQAAKTAWRALHQAWHALEVVVTATKIWSGT